MYCPNCNHLVKSRRRCVLCGSRGVREPEGEDFCFLTEKELIWASALEDLLQQNAIPFVKKNTLGAALAASLGMAMERVRFYVPYAQYETAQTLEQEFFSGEFEFEEKND